MSIEHLTNIGDARLVQLEPEILSAVAETMKLTSGVTLKVFGGRVTLTHDESGAFLVKEPGLTVLGALRTALHMAKCMADPAAARNEPEPVGRYAHARRAEQRRKF